MPVCRSVVRFCGCAGIIARALLDDSLDVSDEKLVDEDELSSDASELLSASKELFDTIDKLLIEDEKSSDESEELFAVLLTSGAAARLLNDELLVSTSMLLAITGELLPGSDCCWLDDDDGGGGVCAMLLAGVTEDMVRIEALGVPPLLPPQAVNTTDIVKTQAIPRKWMFEFFIGVLLICLYLNNMFIFNWRSGEIFYFVMKTEMLF